jgi:hypothetical protein
MQLSSTFGDLLLLCKSCPQPLLHSSGCKPFYQPNRFFASSHHAGIVPAFLSLAQLFQHLDGKVSILLLRPRPNPRVPAVLMHDLWWDR